MPTFIPALPNAEVAVTPSTQSVVPTREVDEFAAYTEEVVQSFLVPLANKGGINETGMHPHVLTEHQEDASASLASVVAAGNTDVGQVFQASQNNVDHATMRLGVVGAGSGLQADDFEPYADTAALQAAWVPADVVNSPNDLDTGVVKQGAKSMRITTSGGLSLLDTFTKTFVAEDWSGIADMQFWVQQTTEKVGDIQLKIRIGDGVNTKSITFGVANKNAWEQKTLALALFVLDGATAPTMTAITTIEFEIVVDNKVEFVYIDDLHVLTDPGTIDIELWSVASATPATLGALLATATIQLSNSLDDRYHVDLGGVAVMAGSHYALVATNPSNVSITVWLLGIVVGGYVNGHAITSADAGATVVVLTGQDAAFEIWARLVGVVVSACVAFDAASGNSVVELFIEDTATETVPRFLVQGFLHLGQLTREFAFEPYLLQNTNEEVEALIQHDRAATAANAAVAFHFRHKPVVVNG